jgi:hypothetical protein
MTSLDSRVALKRSDKLGYVRGVTLVGRSIMHAYVTLVSVIAVVVVVLVSSSSF